MTSVIYYFSGTGNSLHIARSIARQIPDVKLVNIACHSDVSDKIEADCIGLVFPVHFGDMPVTAERFARKMKLTGSPYVYAIATCGAGMPGNTLTNLDRLLRKNGARLSAGFALAMPDNAYTGMNLITPPEQRAGILEASERRLAEIIEVIRRKETVGISGKGATAGRFVMPVMKLVVTRGFRVQKGFRATDQCSGCGICKKICPAGNISVEDKTVTWGGRCTLCLACFHWCPQQAVQLDGKTEKIARYHHPQVAIEDMACTR
ncbi:MAG: EFR1 family ferrodoxin [Methanocella sp.]